MAYEEDKVVARGNRWGPLGAVALLLILALALLLRSSGLVSDFPLALHCDVPKQVMVLKCQGAEGKWGYIHDGYPVGHMQLASALAAGINLLGKWMGRPPGFSDQSLFYLARVTTLALGLLGLLFFMLAARELAGVALALLAGVFLAADPLHFIHGHHAMGDIPQAGMVIGSLYFQLRLLRSNSLMDCFLAGLMAGFAAAMKYYGGCVALGGLLAVWLSAGQSMRAWVKGSLILAVGAISGFVLLTPAIYLNFSHWLTVFADELAYQSKLSLFHRGDVLGWAGHGIYYSVTTLWHDMGLLAPAALLSFFAVSWQAIKGQARDRLLLATSAVGFVIVAVIRSAYLRDWDIIILVPLALLLVVRGAHLLGQSRPGKARLTIAQALTKNWKIRLVAGAVVVLVTLWGVHPAFQMARLYQLPGTKKMAEQWMKNRLPKALPGQKFLVDMTFPSARQINKSDYYYPRELGYDYEQPAGTMVQACKKILSMGLQNEFPYALVHTFKVQGSKPRWCQPSSLALKEFSQNNIGEYFPNIKIFELGKAVAGAPVRLPSLRARGWEHASSANTPLGLREVREIIQGKQPQTKILVSKKPLSHLGIIAQGSGELIVEHASKTYRLKARGQSPAYTEIPLVPSPPNFAHVYRLHLRSTGGRLVVRAALTRAERAALLARAGQTERSVAMWQTALEQGDKLLPQDVFHLARLCHAKKEQGNVEALRAALVKNKAYNALLENRSGNGQKSLGAALGCSMRALAPRVESFPWAKAQAQAGSIIYDPEVEAKAITIKGSGTHETKYWLPNSFAGRRMIARLWLKPSLNPAPKLSADVVGHHNDHVVGVLAKANIDSSCLQAGHGVGGYKIVELAFDSPYLPINLEARVKFTGPGEVKIWKIEVAADMKAWIRENFTWPR